MEDIQEGGQTFVQHFLQGTAFVVVQKYLAGNVFVCSYPPVAQK